MKLNMICIKFHKKTTKPKMWTFFKKPKNVGFSKQFSSPGGRPEINGIISRSRALYSA